MSYGNGRNYKAIATVLQRQGIPVITVPTQRWIRDHYIMSAHGEYLRCVDARSGEGGMSVMSGANMFISDCVDVRGRKESLPRFWERIERMASMESGYTAHVLPTFRRNGACQFHPHIDLYTMAIGEHLIVDTHGPYQLDRSKDKTKLVARKAGVELIEFSGDVGVCHPLNCLILGKKVFGDAGAKNLASLVTSLGYSYIGIPWAWAAYDPGKVRCQTNIFLLDKGTPLESLIDSHADVVVKRENNFFSYTD